MVIRERKSTIYISTMRQSLQIELWAHIGCKRLRGSIRNRRSLFRLIVSNVLSGINIRSFVIFHTSLNQPNQIIGIISGADTCRINSLLFNLLIVNLFVKRRSIIISISDIFVTSYFMSIFIICSHNCLISHMSLLQLSCDIIITTIIVTKALVSLGHYITSIFVFTQYKVDYSLIVFIFCLSWWL